MDQSLLLDAWISQLLVDTISYRSSHNFPSKLSYKGYFIKILLFKKKLSIRTKNTYHSKNAHHS